MWGIGVVMERSSARFVLRSIARIDVYIAYGKRQPPCEERLSYYLFAADCGKECDLPRKMQRYVRVRAHYLFRLQ